MRCAGLATIPFRIVLVAHTLTLVCSYTQFPDGKKGEEPQGGKVGANVLSNIVHRSTHTFKAAAKTINPAAQLLGRVGLWEVS